MSSTSIAQPARRSESETPYWHVYFDAAVNARAERIRQSHRLRSTGVELHLDLYQRPEPEAPVFVWIHGGGGYSGMFVTIALAFYDRGYSVVMPDLKGHGRTGGAGAAKGDFTIPELAQNIVDVVTWTRARFRGPVFAGSGSIGTGFLYNAVAQGAPVEAVASLQFYGLDDPRTALRLSKFAFLARVPGLARLMQAQNRLLARLAPTLRVPYLAIAYWENMLDERDKDQGFVAKWKRDPYTPRTITMAALASMMTSPPVVPLAENRTPWLVINTMRDTMVPPAVTSDTYQRLGGPKQYVEMDWGHFSLFPEFMDEFVALNDRWFRSHMPNSAT